MLFMLLCTYHLNTIAFTNSQFLFFFWNGWIVFMEIWLIVSYLYVLVLRMGLKIDRPKLPLFLGEKKRYNFSYNKLICNSEKTNGYSRSFFNVFIVHLGIFYLSFCWKCFTKNVIKYTCIFKKLSKLKF